MAESEQPPGETPLEPQSALLSFLATLEPIDEDFPEIDDPIPDSVDLFGDDDLCV